MKWIITLAFVFMCSGCEGQSPPRQAAAPDLLGVFQSAAAQQREAAAAQSRRVDDHFGSQSAKLDELATAVAAVNSQLSELRREASADRDLVSDKLANLVTLCSGGRGEVYAEDGDEPAAASNVATLMLFTADYCVNCPRYKAMVPDLTANGERVLIVDLSMTSPDRDRNERLRARYGVEYVPCWIRITDEVGTEVDRVPKQGSDRFTADELNAVLYPGRAAVQTGPSATPSYSYQPTQQQPRPMLYVAPRVVIRRAVRGR